MSETLQERKLTKIAQTTSKRSKDSLSSTIGTKSRPKQQLLQESHVNVAVRCRPMSEKEIGDGHQSIVEFEEDTKIIVHNANDSPSDQLGTKSGERSNYSHIFEFNAVFGCDSTQKQVYDRVCKPIVDSVLEGYNGTIFAYGQTGTGKTYTMEGANWRSASQPGSRRPSKSTSNNFNSSTGSSRERSEIGEVSNEMRVNAEESLGIIPRAFHHIFDYVKKSSHVQFLIRASYLEIYQEELHDLLRKDRAEKLELHERSDVGVYVKNLTWFVCKSISDIERVMRVGNQNRKVGATDMNEHSSRSHAIFMITIEQQQQSTDSEIHKGAISAKLMTGNQSSVIKAGKLNLVDLAGSERQRKTNSFGERQRESIKINLSLAALGNVINSLMKMHTQQQSNNNVVNVDCGGADFIPYRDSKLTRLLQDSLGGNAKTLMIANIGPASYNYNETINTLNYASRAKCIRNRPRLNEDPKDTLLRELQLEINDLRSKLAALNNNNNFVREEESTTNKVEGELGYDIRDSDGSSGVSQNEKLEKELKELEGKLSSLESKLLNGNLANKSKEVNVLDERLLQGYTNEQELELEKRRAELAKQEGREREIRDELERREDAELLIKESFGSIQQEVDTKKRLIRQILLKIKSMRSEIESSQDAYRLELDELDQLQYNLQKDLKLKCLIMDNFIPNDHVDQLLPRIFHDERKNQCWLLPIDLPSKECQLNSETSIEFKDIWKPTDGYSIRPRSESERIDETIYPANICYKYENLIEPKLFVPELKPRKLLDRDTEDCDLSNLTNDTQFSSRYQKLVEEALEQHEPDILL